MLNLKRAKTAPLCFAGLLMAALSSMPEDALAKGTSVFFNRVELSSAQLSMLAQRYGIQMTPGRHWYDRMTGAWGFVGGPTQGFTVAGLSVGGKLWRGASGGRTGVIINGRELHPQDVMGFRALGVPVQRGHWWMDARGNFGYVGGPVMGNIAQFQRQHRRASRRGHVSDRQYRGPLSTWDLTGLKVY